MAVDARWPVSRVFLFVAEIANTEKVYTRFPLDGSKRLAVDFVAAEYAKPFAFGCYEREVAGLLGCETLHIATYGALRDSGASGNNSQYTGIFCSRNRPRVSQSCRTEVLGEIGNR